MLLRARTGTFLTFALAGLLCGVWTSRMPALASKFGTSEGEIGVVVLVWGLGALVAMQGLRSVMGRAGSRAVLRVALPLTAVSYVGVAFAPTYGVLIAAVAVFGMSFGITDIAMNAQASVVEHEYKRPILSSMHAGWCVGAMSGGLIGFGTAHAGLGFSATVLAVAVAALPLALLLGPTYLADRPAPRAASAATGGRRRAKLPIAVYLVGLLAFIGFMTEGSIADWSGLLLHGELGATQAVAALGYPMFQVAMLIGRVGGDHLRMWIGTRNLLTAAGIGTAAAMTVVVTAPSTTVAIIGFFLSGLVVATVVPISMSLAGTSAPGQPAAAVAQAGAMGYGGLLLGPVVVGFLADATSLRIGVGAVVLLALVIAVGSRFVPLGAGEIGSTRVEEAPAEGAAETGEPTGEPVGVSVPRPNGEPQPVTA
ncbi:MFS transporter [Actinomadura harenae]|uniref:MFS transporter n=1 Tax=Actinomadura harenae TaxID=2483351 RepID=A0A3M2M263_9ACTN|nr:MFS transporter [Actinomadura harenae]RMI43834.1 MFS transporter [Actinomadura harenae]